jgi:putative sigma-54 modulation protein
MQLGYAGRSTNKHRPTNQLHGIETGNFSRYATNLSKLTDSQSSYFVYFETPLFPRMMLHPQQRRSAMHIDIRAKGFDLTQGLREHTERRLNFALSWATYDVRQVAVRLSDVNGPRGGEDKRCCIQVVLPGAQKIVIEDTKDNVYLAINRAVDRAERSIARCLQRRREHRRGTLRKAAPVETNLAIDE